MPARCFGAHQSVMQGRPVNCSPGDSAFEDPEMSQAAALLANGEQHFLIPSPVAGLRVFIRRLAPSRRQTENTPVVLYVHGATFPSALSIAYRFDGVSWRDA